MADRNTTMTELTRETLQELRAFRDDVRVRLHLANLEARTAWDEDVRPELEKIEGLLEGAVEQARALSGSDEVNLKAHLAVMEIRDRWRELEPYLRSLVGRFEAAGGGAARAAVGLPERARLKARLAAMDARDAVEARSRELRGLLGQAGTTAESAARGAVRLVREAIGALRPGGRRKSA